MLKIMILTVVLNVENYKDFFKAPNNLAFKLRPKAWFFGQFNAPFLDCACDLLDRADLSTHSYQLNDLASYS